MHKQTTHYKKKTWEDKITDIIPSLDSLHSNKRKNQKKKTRKLKRFNKNLKSQSGQGSLYRKRQGKKKAYYQQDTRDDKADKENQNQNGNVIQIRTKEVQYLKKDVFGLSDITNRVGNNTQIKSKTRISKNLRTQVTGLQIRKTENVLFKGKENSGKICFENKNLLKEKLDDIYSPKKQNNKKIKGKENNENNSQPKKNRFGKRLKNSKSDFRLIPCSKKMKFDVELNPFVESFCRFKVENLRSSSVKVKSKRKIGQTPSNFENHGAFCTLSKNPISDFQINIDNSPKNNNLNPNSILKTLDFESFDKLRINQIERNKFSPVTQESGSDGISPCSDKLRNDELIFQNSSNKSSYIQKKMVLKRFSNLTRKEQEIGSPEQYQLLNIDYEKSLLAHSCKSLNKCNRFDVYQNNLQNNFLHNNFRFSNFENTNVEVSEKSKMGNDSECLNPKEISLLPNQQKFGVKKAIILSQFNSIPMMSPQLNPNYSQNQVSQGIRTYTAQHYSIGPRGYSKSFNSNPLISLQSPQSEFYNNQFGNFKRGTPDYNKSFNPRMVNNNMRYYPGNAVAVASSHSKLSDCYSSYSGAQATSSKTSNHCGIACKKIPYKKILLKSVKGIKNTGKNKFYSGDIRGEEYSNKYKTELCKNFLFNGKCQWGNMV